MSTMTEWTAAVCRELGLDEATEGTTELVLNLTADVAHGVARPAAPVTSYLLGLAAGRADDPAAATHDYAETISGLAKSWGSGEGRGEPAGDQEARG